MYSAQVSFIPLQSADVLPPIVAGRSDSIWVRVKRRSPKDAIAAARRKVLECYGVEITSVSVSWIGGSK